MTGAAITRKSSFLLDSLGKRIFPEGITIIDDPVRPRGLRSRPFDGEGLPTRRSALIDQGVLTGWLLDSASARQLGLTPTGPDPRGSRAEERRVGKEGGSTCRALMTGVQTCALPISQPLPANPASSWIRWANGYSPRGSRSLMTPSGRAGFVRALSMARGCPPGAAPSSIKASLLVGCLIAHRRGSWA